MSVSARLARLERANRQSGECVRIVAADRNEADSKMAAMREAGEIPAGAIIVRIITGVSEHER